MGLSGNLRTAWCQDKVTLVWVPGHKGYEYNEEADQLAPETSSAAHIGPELFCGITRSTIRTSTKHWLAQKSNDWGITSPGQRQGKGFIQRRLLKLNTYLKSK